MNITKSSAQHRVIFCSDKCFPPHGNAGGNLMLHYAKSIQCTGRQVMIVSQTEYEEVQGEYEGIEYHNYSKSKGIKEKISDGRRALHVLNVIGISSNDIVLIYATNIFFVWSVIKFCKKNKISYGCIIVEWDSHEGFKKGYFDPRLWASNLCYMTAYSKGNNQLCISNKIASYFLSKGKNNVCVVPPLIDSKNGVKTTFFPEHEGVSLFYPGNPAQKDDLGVILAAISKLPKDSREKIYLHTTIAGHDILSAQCKIKNLDYENVKRNVIVHGKLLYENLIELYEQMDFLVIPRYKYRTNEANFPSKMAEAMILGLPVISNDVGDFPSYIMNGRSGFIASKCDIDDYVKILERVLDLNHQELSDMKRYAIQDAVEYFDYKKYSLKFEEYLSNMS